MGHRKYPGIRCRRGKNGHIYWYTDTRVGGRKGKRVYKKHGIISQAEAERRHKAIMELEHLRLEDGKPPIDIPLSPTVEEVMEKWLIELEDAGRDEKTILAYRRNLRFLLMFYGNRAASSVTLTDAQAFRVALKKGQNPDGTPMERVPSVRYRKDIISTCSSLFRFASSAGRRLATENPFAQLIPEKAPKGSSRKKGEYFRRLHPREDAQLIGAAQDDWRKCAIAVGLYLGVRATPTVSLRLEDINLENDTICVVSEFNKGHASGVRSDHWLPIPKHLKPYLEAQHAIASDLGTPWLFPSGVMVQGRHSATGHIAAHKLAGVVKRAAREVGYDDGVDFKGLRAICKNRLDASRISDRLKESYEGGRDILGHSSEQAARPYVDGIVEYRRVIIHAYDKWLTEMENSKPAIQLEKLEAKGIGAKGCQTRRGLKVTK